MPDLLSPRFLQMDLRSIIYGEPGIDSTFWIPMRRMFIIYFPASAVSSSIKALHVLASLICGPTFWPWPFWMSLLAVTGIFASLLVCDTNVTSFLLFSIR